MSDYPSRLKAMADFSLESDTVTKIIPKGMEFLRETAEYVETLERIIFTHCDPMAMPDEDAKVVMGIYYGKTQT